MTSQIDRFVPYLYTTFEKEFDSTLGREYTQNNNLLPYGLVLVYLLSICCGKLYMKNRPPYHLKQHLALWNGTLTIFSFAGALRTTPELLWRLHSQSFTEIICNDSTTTWGTGSCGFWVQLFIFSKIPELFDTFFIIARKKPLLFLHWYHHITVLLYSWNCYASQSSQTLAFCAVNYLVHSMMYGYYCLTSINLKPAFLKPVYITSAQIIQMIIGTYIQIIAFHSYHNNPSCNVDKNNIVSGGIMYLSYLGLFSRFAFKRYMQKRIKKIV